jgi:hypothetical protein
LEAADGLPAEIERGGPIVQEERYSGRPDQVGGALIADCRAELAAFAQAGAGLFGVSLDDGRAYLEQGGGDECRGAELAGQRECFVRQRDPAGRVISEHVAGHCHRKLDGRIGEVAACPRDTGGLFGEAGGVREGADSNRDVLAGAADCLLDAPVRGIPARVRFGRAAA